MTITWRGPLLLASLVAVLALAGCGGGDDGSDTGTGSASAATVAEGGGAATTSGGDEGGGTATQAAGDDFCEKLENIGKNLQDQTNMSDPQKLSAFFSQVADALESADPPSEIRDNWNTLEDLFSTYAKVFADVDFSDPESLQGLQDDMQKFADKQDELQSATTALSRYAADHCGGAF